MAKSSKSSSGESKSSKAAVEEADVTTSSEDGPELLSNNPVVKDAPPDISDDEDSFQTDEVATHPDLEIEIVDDVIEPDVNTADSEAPTTLTATNGTEGFFPLLLGGVVAGAIGWGISTYFDGGDDVSAQLAAQSDQIAALEAQLAAVPTVDVSGLEQQVEDGAAQSNERLSEITESVNASLDALDARLNEVEKRPGADGTLSETALAAYQRELQDLRAELDAQQQGVMSAAAQAEADLAAARAESEQMEQQALAAAEAASARAALNRIRTAVDTGAPFDDALSGLSGDIPTALTAAAPAGVATSAELVAEYPTAARAALAAARSEGVSEDAGGIGGFFRDQFDVRSTAPREGSDPDAVLSRAEAATKEGRVSDALAEIDALPEVARAEMTDWTSRATERADVLDAIATLSETYN